MAAASSGSGAVAGAAASAVAPVPVLAATAEGVVASALAGLSPLAASPPAAASDTAARMRSFKLERRLAAPPPPPLPRRSARAAAAAAAAATTARARKSAVARRVVHGLSCRVATCNAGASLSAATVSRSDCTAFWCARNSRNARHPATARTSCSALYDTSSISSAGAAAASGGRLPLSSLCDTSSLRSRCRVPPSSRDARRLNDSVAATTAV